MSLQSAGGTRRDALTRLDNRRGMHARLEDLAGGEVVVMLDLDHFKVVNDSRGHAGGDAVLEDFAWLLTSQMRAGDCAARYGGEEFLLLLADTDADRAAQVLRRMHTAWASTQPGITFSGGYAVHDARVDAALPVGDADGALYVAKRAGRDRDLRADQSPHTMPQLTHVRIS